MATGSQLDALEALGPELCAAAGSEVPYALSSCLG